MHYLKRTLLLLFCISALSSSAQNTYPDTLPYINLSDFQDGIHHWMLFSPIRKYSRFDSSDIKGIADNLVAYQNQDGGWPKNIDWLAKLDADSVKMTLSERYRESTFDNQNIYPQIEYLSKVYYYTGDIKYRNSVLSGLKYIINMQHRKGGWKGSDVDAITFNDGVMTGTMNLLMNILNGEEYYNWLSKDIKEKIRLAFNKALSTTLQCQIEVEGVKTAWCQQHDHNSFEPVKARSYELPSITARESTDVILFLMKIKNPEDSVVESIESAIAWFERSKIVGYSYEKIKIPEVKYHETTVDFDQVFIADSLAKPVWARYYEIETNNPFLCRRDGTVVYKLEEIGFERRVGYAWYGYWPEEALLFYPQWKASLSTP